MIGEKTKTCCLATSRYLPEVDRYRSTTGGCCYKCCDAQHNPSCKFSNKVIRVYSFFPTIIQAADACRCRGNLLLLFLCVTNKRIGFLLMTKRSNIDIKIVMRRYIWLKLPLF